MHKLEFYFPTKETLNSNRMPNAMIVKSKIAANIRQIGVETGLALHKDPITANERFKVIEAEDKVKSEKARSRKRLKKAGVDEAEIEEKIKKIEADLSPEKSRDDFKIDYFYNKFTVQVEVFSLTKGRIDPPNFYPTIKHLIDGLTDASWWKDDNFDQLIEMSFRYGGVTDKKGFYKFVLTIEEITE